MAGAAPEPVTDENAARIAAEALRTIARHLDVLVPKLEQQLGKAGLLALAGKLFGGR